MLDRFARGWALAKASFHVLRLDTEMLLLPVLSGIIMILIAAGVFAPLLFSALARPGSVSAGLLLAAYLVVHFAGYFVVIFFNAAVVHMATIRFDGGDPVLKDGLRASKENWRLIAQWAVVAATVGLVLHVLQSAARERGGFIGQILASVLQTAWNAIVYFVVPLLVYRKMGPMQAIKESGSLIRRTWGETLAGEVGVGFVFLLLGLAGVLVLVAGSVLGGSGLVMLGLLAAVVVYWLLLAVTYSAAQGVLTAALYKYATTGQVPQGFDRGLVARAIV